MIVLSLLGSRFGRCGHRTDISEFRFTQNSGCGDSVIFRRREHDPGPRYQHVVIRASLAILGGIGAAAFSGLAFSQPLTANSAHGGAEVSVAQVPAGLRLRFVSHRPVAAPAHTQPETSSALTKMAEQAATAHTLPIGYFLRLIRQESGFNPNSVSPAGAQGIAQFMPATASDRGLRDPFDPAEALPKSAELLNELRDQFGNLGLAAAAYNAGADRVHKWLAGKSQLPQETIDYVRIITGHDAADWAKSNDLALNTNFDGSGLRIHIDRLSWEAQLLATLQAASADASATSVARDSMLRSPAAKTGEASLCSHCILQSAY